MALVEGCKHALEVSVPVEAIDQETAKVAVDFQKKVRLPGFRPGKAPASMVKKNFESEIRQKVVENLIPRYLDQQVEAEHLRIVSQPNVIDVHFTPGEPLVFKAEFEVAPEFELGEYRGLEVPYSEPAVTEEDINGRIEEMRNSKATFANVDARPLADGDFAVISIESLAGADEPVKSDELTLEVGGKTTMQAFSDGLRGMSPGEEKDVEVTYPDEAQQAKLAGKTVTFHVVVKGVRVKELPELNDEFAQDMGDFRNVEELREAVKKAIFAQLEHTLREVAKNKLVDKLVDAHSFAVPEIYVDRQLENRLTQRLQAAAEEGVDVSQFRPDWDKLRETQGDLARREVMASLLLGKIAEREGIGATQEDMDRQIEAIAKRERQPVPVVKRKMEENGGISRIASHIATEKTLAFLFEQATKVAE